MKQGLLLTLILSGLAAHAADMPKKPWELEWSGAARRAANSCVDFQKSFGEARCKIVVRGEQGFDIQIDTAEQSERQVTAGMHIASDLCVGMKMRVALIVKVGSREKALAAFVPPRCNEPSVFEGARDDVDKSRT